MKPSKSLILTLSFLLWFSFTITKPSLASENTPVSDLNGDPISPGQEYYIVSAIWGAGGGGVNFARTGDSSCSYSVIQERSDLRSGVPVEFRILGKSTRMIYPGYSKLEIEFVDKPHCAQSSMWKVAHESSGSSSSSSLRLVIGGPKDHPQAELVGGYFQIENMGTLGYKLMFCTMSNSDECYNVAIEYQDEYRHLVLKASDDDHPFMVVFRKADSDKGKSTI